MIRETSTALPAPPLASWTGFIAMCVGMFMAILDIQIVATSLPSIQEALAIRPDQMSWIQTSYLIAERIAIPLTGWLTHGLFHRAILQSPGLPTGRKTVLPLTPLKHTEQLGLDYAHPLTGDNAIRLLYGDGIKRY